MQAKTSTLRIIGGKWGSRTISFVPLKGVRPTPNAVRETLFNWLAPVIVDANCLDLFAGSGALGFEALSRGAKHVVMVDAAVKVIHKLKENAAVLQTTDAIDFYFAKIPQGLDKIPQQAFDVIFLDPPFSCDLMKITCDKLSTSNYLKKDTLIYAEVERKLDVETLIPPSWQVLRKKLSGLVKSYLLQVG